jgi:serine/threonine protein kinase/tetratricopeptide (TPR) repeat protein
MAGEMPDEKAIFNIARQIGSPDAQAEYLRQACGADSGLRERVQVLLHAYEEQASFLESPHPSVVAPMTDPPAAESECAVIGPYKLIEQIGEGGMGAVWMAQQHEPVKRAVALKLIKAGMDSRQVVARFEAERQALALMDHPNIARVLDAGTTPLGRPYFVMDLVKGVPITRYCDEHRLSPRQRLELFIPICQAVQHAHQKGIIHRDLKPSNVLVALYDGKPVPKVIDFGVAKATGQQLTDKTLVTGFGAVVGTLEYMSPEQAEINQLDIDTRSDVYSLGVILYELLAGSPPFSRTDLDAAGMLEMLRVLREKEPSRPSTKLSTSEGLPTLAANRGTEPAKLTKLVRGELDWIVMKALEKDRDRRYETANGFATDVQRYLAGEVVQACPPSAAYRLRKFVRRNKTVVVAAGLVLASLVLGIIGTSIGMWRAEQRRVEAEQAKGEAQTAKEKAEQAEAQTLEEFRAGTADAIEQLIGSKSQIGLHEKAYLERTLKRWQVFADRQGDDERSMAVRAEGHFRVGLLWGKIGRREEARRELEAAHDLRKKLAAQYPDVPEHQLELANCDGNLGMLLLEHGDRKAGQQAFEAARDLLKKLVAQYPDAPKYQQPLAKTHHSLGNLRSDLGEHNAARQEFEAARDLQMKLVARHPSFPTYQDDLAITHHSLGIRLDVLGERDAARQEFAAAIELQKKLVALHPDVPLYQFHLANTHNSIGMRLRNFGEREAARQEFVAARDLQKTLVAEFPAVPSYHQDLANSHNNLGILLRLRGKPEEARQEFETALEVQKKLVEQHPDLPRYKIDLGGSYCNVGNVLARDKSTESLAFFDLAIATLEPVHRSDPRQVLAKQYLRNGYWSRAAAYDALKKNVEAVKDWDKAIELSPPAEQPRFRTKRATSKLNAGMVAEAVAEVAELIKSSKWSSGQWYDFACVYAVASGKVAEKRQAYAGRAMELLHQAVKAGWKDAAHMKQDKDLDALRERDDFKKLIADLEATKK